MKERKQKLNRINANLHLIYAMALGMLAPGYAAPINPDHISAQAKWYAHLDMEAFRTSQLGGEMIAVMEERHGRQIRAFGRILGLDLLGDINHFTLYGRSTEKDGVVLIHGNFEPQHLIDIAAANQEYQAESHGAHTIHRWLDKDKNKLNHGAFVGSELLVMADRKESVMHALDVISKQQNHLSAQSMTLGAGQAPFVIGVINLDAADQAKPEAKILKHVESLWLSVEEVKENIEITMNLTAKDDQNVGQVQKVLDGVIALIQMSDDHSGVADALVNVEFTRLDSGLKAKLAIPVKEAMAILESLEKRKNQKKKEQNL